uniref:Bm11832 n=1 Tax=Brugia malayi TaxID=6279 RepID=A0A1I9GAB7_BRUMA|nr:Bm11832 [Brugia malayi]
MFLGLVSVAEWCPSSQLLWACGIGVCTPTWPGSSLCDGLILPPGQWIKRK